MQTALFSPDARDSSRDFHIPYSVAIDLYGQGRIARDLTNGTFCPICPNGYVPREHKRA